MNCIYTLLVARNNIILCRPVNYCWKDSWDYIQNYQQCLDKPLGYKKDHICQPIAKASLNPLNAHPSLSSKFHARSHSLNYCISVATHITCSLWSITLLPVNHSSSTDDSSDEPVSTETGRKRAKSKKERKNKSFRNQSGYHNINTH